MVVATKRKSSGQDGAADSNDNLPNEVSRCTFGFALPTHEKKNNENKLNASGRSSVMLQHQTNGPWLASISYRSRWPTFISICVAIRE